MPSFDIVSKTDLSEADNAVQGVVREIGTRFDFKGSKCTIERKEALITIVADDALKLKQMQELVKGYFVRRKLDPRCLDWKPEEAASGNTVRQTVTIKQGIDKEVSKTIVKALKDAKMKVQASIQGDELRITGKKKDELQEAIQHVRGLGIELPLQFVNFRE
jgi:uncharacterized protein YajQ (UPF0234 family)